MKRQQRVDDLLQAVGDIAPGRHRCGRLISSGAMSDECRVCDIIDQLALALVKFETDEALDRGADIIDAESIG